MSGDFCITVSEDRLRAALSAPAGERVGAGEVIARLKEMGIVGFDDGVIIETLEGWDATKPLELEVARGVAAEESTLRMKFRVPVAGDFSTTTSAVSKVEAGQVLGVLTAGKAMVPGRDVFGAAVVIQEAIALGRNVEINNGEITATARGNFCLQDGVVSVEPLLEVMDDRVVPKDFAGDVYLKGSLTEGRTLTTPGRLVIGGTLEAAEVQVGGSVFVGGGVVGKMSGRYTIGGDLRCRFITGGALKVGGNVEVLADVVKSRLTCNGRVKVARGQICGGEIAAGMGLECMSLGHISGMATVVEVGESGLLRAAASATRGQIELNRRRIKDVREKIEPLMRVVKQLTPKQRERATELLAEAEELECVTQEMEAALAGQLSALQAAPVPEVRVSREMHAGVTLRVGARQTVIGTALRGPFTVTLQRMASGLEMVLVDGKTTVVLASSASEVGDGSEKAGLEGAAGRKAA